VVNAKGLLKEFGMTEKITKLDELKSS